MTTTSQIAAIAPGWFITAALVLLVLAIVWAFLEGNEQEEQLDRIMEDHEPEEPKTVQVGTPLYDWESEKAGGVR